MDDPTPTEVIASWVPHDARWHHQARTAAIEGMEPMRRYITELVMRYEEGGSPLADEFDQRTIGAVREDLGAMGCSGVDWRQVQDALLLPLRAQERL